MNLFGLNFFKKEEDKQENRSAAIAPKMDSDGGAIAATGAAYYGVYLNIGDTFTTDIDNIIKCREISLHSEVDTAIQDIVNEAVPQSDTGVVLDLNLNNVDLSDGLKKKIQEEFSLVLKLFKYKEYAPDIFRRWYIDGKIYYQIIVDKDNLKRGIVDLIPLDATKIKKVKEIVKTKTSLGVDAIKEEKEYFVFNQNGFSSGTINNNQNQSLSGIKISKDSILYASSGYLDSSTNQPISYLSKAIRAANQLRMLEDAVVIYMLARAPERRIFYIGIGNLPVMKGEQYVTSMMNKFRNKMVYDSSTGTVKDDKRYMSMLEDFWIPRRDDGKGTEVATLPGAQNIQGMLDNVEYFRRKLYESLQVPASRYLQQQSFSLGRSTEITRDEIKFQRFIDKLRLKFGQLILDALKVQLLLKGIVNESEWDELVQDISLVFAKDNAFDEIKEQEILQNRIALLQNCDPYIGTYFSKEYVWKNVLKMTDKEISEIKDQINKEKEEFSQFDQQDPNNIAMQQQGQFDNQEQ